MVKIQKNMESIQIFMTFSLNYFQNFIAFLFAQLFYYPKCSSFNCQFWRINQKIMSNIINKLQKWMISLILSQKSIAISKLPNTDQNSFINYIKIHYIFQFIRMEQDLHSNAQLFQPNNTRARRSTTISQERRQQSQKKEEVIKRKKKKTLSGISSGPWNMRQTKLFIKFLRDHRNSFYGLKSRRKQKIFIKMSDFIGSRTPDQCRSHHQKVMFHFKQLDDMIVHYQVQFLTKNQKNNQVFHVKKQIKEAPTTQSQNKGPYSIKYSGDSLIITINQSSIKIIQ